MHSAFIYIRVTLFLNAQYVNKHLRKKSQFQLFLVLGTGYIMKYFMVCQLIQAVVQALDFFHGCPSLTVTVIFFDTITACFVKGQCIRNTFYVCAISSCWYLVEVACVMPTLQKNILLSSLVVEKVSKWFIGVL